MCDLFGMARRWGIWLSVRDWWNGQQMVRSLRTNRVLARSSCSAAFTSAHPSMQLCKTSQRLFQRISLAANVVDDSEEMPPARKALASLLSTVGTLPQSW
jgi:hypothetical protein